MLRHFLFHLVESSVAPSVLEVEVESCFGDQVLKYLNMALASCKMGHMTQVVIANLEINLTLVEKLELI